jgi:hypothetical protein
VERWGCSWLALILTFSPPSSLRFDTIAPKPKAKADRRRNSLRAICGISGMFDLPTD